MRGPRPADWKAQLVTVLTQRGEKLIFTFLVFLGLFEEL